MRLVTSTTSTLRRPPPSTLLLVSRSLRPLWGEVVIVTRGGAGVNNTTHSAHVECRHVKLPVWAGGEGDWGGATHDLGTRPYTRSLIHPHPFPHTPLKPLPRNQ
ncbi:hypothetical protein Pcinc_027493 [Petrolisthes cinctipes]|uniref:Uncharacterized protein n=1 Tax=Petrolisthes cinctipes TaxID=88211 RepID=A0AAE1K6R3_PETCI|nr:hypothetical protein Pcinc_027493 [Petrolisthes cinctipes]